jgi:peptidyl-prolyl cis-trans isomerase SurA
VLQFRRTALLPGLEKVTEGLLFSAKADHLDREDPAFSALLREYREGILLYQVEQDNVWSRVASNDSSLRAFFEDRRDEYTYPDRVRFSELRLANARAATIIAGELSSGATLEEIARRDSVRMAQPSELRLPMSAGSSKIPQSSANALRALTAELKSDSLLHLRFLARADTTSRAERNRQIASRRLRSLRLFSTGSLAIAPERIDTLMQRGSWSTSHTQDTIAVSLVGRQRRVSGAITTSTLAPGADPRAQRADSLVLGATSEPFVHNTGTIVVRLDGREPARRKTFEEAAPEVATAFQDFESKRLEQQWLQELETKFPVTKHPEVLHQAFSAPK